MGSLLKVSWSQLKSFALPTYSRWNVCKFFKNRNGENVMDECADQGTETSTRLTYEEENVIRYVGGYVLQILKKATFCKDISNILDAIIEKTLLKEFPPSNFQTYVG